MIVDNGSTDATQAIAERLVATNPRIDYIRHDQHVPVNASYSRAFAEANGKYTKLVGVDDLLYPRCLELMVGLAEEHQLGIVGSKRQHGDVVDLDGLPETIANGREVLRQSLLGRLHIMGSPSSLLFRTELIERRQPFFDPTFARHADTEAAYWTLTHSDFGHVKTVLTYTNYAGESVYSDRLLSYYPEHLRMIARYGPRVFNFRRYREHFRNECVGYGLLLVRAQKTPEFVDFHRQALDLLAGESRRAARAAKLLRCLI